MRSRPPETMTTDVLYERLWDFAAHRVLTTASKVGLLHRLADSDGPFTVDQLSVDLKLDPLAAGKVVRALCAMGVAKRDGDGYRLVPTLVTSFSGGVEDLAAFVLHVHAMYERWGAQLEDWLRTGQSARRKMTGSDVERFADAMQASASMLAPQLVQALDLSGARRALDLGGGIGAYARVLCEAAGPSLEVTVLDVPDVAELGERRLAGDPLESRIHFRGGDYHETDLGSDYDLVLLANVLHIDPAPRAEALIDRAAAALAPGGRLAIVEFVIDDAQHADLLGCLFAINMRSFGDTHPAPLLSSWMTGAGLAQIERVELPPAHWLIHGSKR